MPSKNTLGRIVLLNGASSSGKTTIAECLQDILDTPYLIVGLDVFFDLYNESFPAKHNPAPIPKDVSMDERLTLIHKCEIRNRRRETFHYFLAAFSKAGNDIIVDTVLDAKQVLEHCLDILYDYPVLLVGVRCPLEELEKREKVRGDRIIGLAKIQFERVHAHTLYDVEVDTSKLNPMECALKIKRVIEAIPKDSPSKTWEKLRGNVYPMSKK